MFLLAKTCCSERGYLAIASNNGTNHFVLLPIAKPACHHWLDNSDQAIGAEYSIGVVEALDGWVE